MLVRIGDKVVEVDSNGVIKATSKEIKRPDGGTDIEIHVPCLKVIQKQGGSDGVRNIQPL